MLASRLDQVDEALLNAVCNEHWQESGTLDFKRSLPANSDAAKQEFQKDVSAFANANGGDLVFGIEEDAGHANALRPIDPAASPIDAVKRRLGQLLESGVEPRVEGVAMHAVTLANGRYVLVVRVPESFRKPHRSRSLNDHWRWSVRSGTHTADLTYDQIRDAFDRVGSLQERARQFRDARLSGVLSGSNGRAMRAGPRCVVHLIPLASLAGKASVNVAALYNDYLPFIFHDWGGASRTLNLDGLSVHPGGNGAQLANVQIFRSGALEFVRYVGALIDHQDPDLQNTIPSGVVADVVRESLEKFMDACVRWNITGPAVASVALLDLGQFSFVYQPRNRITERGKADRPNLILPEVWIDQLSGAADVDKLARPLLDTVWQSFDLERCGFYDNDGTYTRH